MNSLGRFPLLGAVLFLLVMLLGTEAWLWARGRESARHALAALGQKKLERDRLARQSPALSEANEQAIARDLVNTRQLLAALQSSLQGSESQAPVASPPVIPLEAYFDLADFVEKTHALSARAQVMIGPDERFGFASYANEGPAAGLVPAVWRQRLLGQHLIEALLEARPLALLSVRRNRPRSSESASAAVNPAGGGVAADFFDLEPQMTLTVAGSVDADAFRLEFTGQTSVLRAFLNTLAAFKFPVIVRSVEVEPMVDRALVVAVATTPGATETPVPLVGQNLSRFSVVVEWVVAVGTPRKPVS